MRSPHPGPLPEGEGVIDMVQHDVIIIGGGIVGATLACLLGDAGIATVVVEARMPEQPATPEPRAFAISRASERIFRSASVWDKISAAPYCSFTDMEVWDAAGSNALHFDCAEIAESCLGHIIEPSVMQYAAAQRLQQIDSVEFLCPARFESIAIDDEQVVVQLADGLAVSAALLVAADGANSPVRTALGIDVQRHAYRQSGVVARVQTELPHLQTAWQRFLPGGPLAFLPLADGWSSIVWTLPEQDIEQILSLDESAFNNALGEAFDYRLGRIIASGPRASWPLVRQHADRYVDARVALIGDAAHAIHPLAGQGVNLGLLDAASLAEVVIDAEQQRGDAGRLRDLRRYERWRRSDNQLMMSAMDGLNGLFSNAVAPVQWLRDTGLGAVGRMPLLRDMLVRHAMGLAGDLPAAARSVNN